MPGPFPRDHRPGALALAGLLAGPFLSMVDTNVVNVAVPEIARGMQAPLAAVQWTVSGYLLALGTALACSAFLERRFGSRPLYIASLAAFTAASAACALAPSLPFLVAGRVVQGLAAAPLVPVAMGMLLSPSGSTRPQIPAAAGVLLFLAPAAGPALGGILISAFGWPSIFLINLPFGLLGLRGALSLGDGVGQPRRAAAPLDVIGAAVLASGLGLTVYGSGAGPVNGWISIGAAPFWSAGVLCIGLYVMWSRRQTHPILRLTILHAPQAGLALGVSAIASVVLFAALFLIPVFLQTAQHLTPFQAGLVLLPQGAVMGVGMAATERLVRHGRWRETVVAGTLALSMTTAAMLLIDPNTPAWVTALVLSGRGLALGLIIQPLLARMLDGISADGISDASTVFNVGERLAGSLGIALLASAYAAIGFHSTVLLLLLLAILCVPGALLVRNPSAGSLSNAAHRETYEHAA